MTSEETVSVMEMVLCSSREIAMAENQAGALTGNLSADLGNFISFYVKFVFVIYKATL